MGVKVATFTLTVPGHVVRRGKEGGTELEITGEQARYILEELSEVEHLLPLDADQEFSVEDPLPVAEMATKTDFSKAPAAPQGSTT